MGEEIREMKYLTLHLVIEINPFQIKLCYYYILKRLKFILDELYKDLQWMASSLSSEFSPEN